MLDTDAVNACEEAAVADYVAHGLDPERPVSVVTLCEKFFGRGPEAVRGLPREALSGILAGEVLIRYRAGTPEPRARFLCAHEAAHRRRGDHHGGIALVEARADLLGACLLAPRPAFAKMVDRVGHSVYDLAHAFGITHAAAMLRLGEVTGRPVRLLGARERLRGEPFPWETVDVRRALAGRLRKTVHPIKLRDEQKWGLMQA